MVVLLAEALFSPAPNIPCHVLPPLGSLWSVVRRHLLFSLSLRCLLQSRRHSGDPRAPSPVPGTKYDALCVIQAVLVVYCRAGVTAVIPGALPGPRHQVRRAGRTVPGLARYKPPTTRCSKCSSSEPGTTPPWDLSSGLPPAHFFVLICSSPTSSPFFLVKNPFSFCLLKKSYFLGKFLLL